jgi:hypothetical protein
MPTLSSGGSAPTHAPHGRDVLALTLGGLAFVVFWALAAPTDLLMLDLIQYTGPLAPTIHQLTYGPEILLAPVGLLIAVAALIVGRSATNAMARAGVALGWITLALYGTTIILVVLSFLGVAKPLI